MSLSSLSIKNKIIAIVLLINILAIGISYTVFTLNNIHDFKDKMTANTSATAKLVAEYCSVPLTFNRPEMGVEVLRHLQTEQQISNAIIFTKNGEMFATYNRTNEIFALNKSPQPKSFTQYTGNFLQATEPIIYKNEILGTIYLRITTTELQKNINNHILTMLLLMLLSWLIASILAYYFQKIISKPILMLASVTKGISTKNDYSIRVTKKHNDEIGYLYDGFNNMLDVILKREHERDKATIELKESEERFRTIAFAANDAIIVLDEAGLITFWNSAAERIFGYSDNEMKGANLHSIIVPVQYQKLYYAGMKTFRETGTGPLIGNSIELKAIRKSGTEFDVEISISATRINDNWYSIGIVKDITLRKEVEENLRIAKQRAEDSDRLKSAFLANMSHEIRTPMNAIIGFTDLLRRPDISDDKRKQFINIIHKNNNILLKLIDDLLDISKIESGQLNISEEIFNPDEIMIELTDLYLKERVSKEKLLVDIKLDIDESYKGKFKLTTDKFRLRQVLSNLLSNALKFTDTGVIEFGYKPTDDDKLIFFVTDTGIGIPKEKLDVIFDRFHQADNSLTRKYGGTGLGLAISKGLMEVLGGKISVTSTPGQGSTFFVEIPNVIIEGEKIDLPIKQITNKEYNWSDKLMLIVEDEDSNIVLLKEALVQTSVKILWARDGKPAVDICRSNGNIDLVLMDIQMPEMNGYEATQKIKEFRKDLPIIAQTAYAMENEREKSIDAGCKDYITKPLNIKELLTIINKYINLRNG